MDDELFRFYFKQLYKNLIKIESTFLSFLQPHERPDFFLYSTSLKDISSCLKCEREAKAEGEKK